MVKYLEDEKSTITDLEGDINVESDCESDSTGADGKSEKEKEEGGNRAVLVVGSFSAYVSFLPSPSCSEK